MPVHEQRESGSRGGAGSGRRSARNGGGNEQSNYQAVASETIFLLRFLSPSAPQACKTFSTHTYIYVCVCVCTSTQPFLRFPRPPMPIHVPSAECGSRFRRKTGKYGFINLTRWIRSTYPFLLSGK